MPRVIYLQFYYVIAITQKIGDNIIIETKYSKRNSFHVISDLLNSDNLKVAITQLCHELQVCNFTML